MSLPPQGVAPRRTVPPDTLPSALDRFKRLLDWKVAAGALIGFGIYIAQVQASVVTRAEFDAARKDAAGEHAAMKTETQKLSDRTIRSEVSLEWIGAQVAEIARVTGARVVPQPAAPAPNP